MKRILLFLLCLLFMAACKTKQPQPKTNEAPVASFTLTPESGVVPLAVTVNGGGSSDPDGSVRNFVWNWGDESADNSGESVSHTFNKAGEFTVTLTVTDDKGSSASSTKSVSVTTTSEPEPDTTPDGTLDESFGNKGKVVFGTTNFESARDIALQSDGTLVTVGVQTDSQPTFPSAEGTLIIFFNPDGTVKKNVLFPAEFSRSATITPDDGIIIVGQTDPTDDGVDNRVIYVRRLNPDGTPDTDFGGQGIVLTTLTIGGSGSFVPEDIVLDSQGRMVIGGTSDGDDDVGSTFAFQLVRLTANGQFDPSFNTSGIVKTKMKFDDQLSDITLDAEERIIAVGKVSAPGEGGNFVAVRYDKNGNLDSSFGPLGKGFSEVDVIPEASTIASSVSLDAEGRILLSGDALSKLALVRLDKNGFLDKTFGDDADGKLVLDVGRSSNTRGLAVDSKGRILVVGRQMDNDSKHAFFALRFNSEGELDNSYRANGGQFVDFGDVGSLDGTIALLDAQQKLVIAGTKVDIAANNIDIVLTRLN